MQRHVARIPTRMNVAVRFVFDSSDECTIVHSALYSCLRAVFGLSVAGVLVAVFSCMLVYQLLSHERKKMYWEQLELRCRSLYAGPQPTTQVSGGPSIIGTPRGGPCRCCEQCHSHRNIIPSAYPWDGDNRFWTPAPGSAGNFYSPNPGGEEHIPVAGRPIRNQRPGWSWPRLPWQRNDPQRFRQTPSSPDSQYGFNSQNGADANNLPSSGQGYAVIGPPHYGVWGPPPPYSDPNSPARRGRYQYIHPSQCQQLIDHNIPPQQSNLAILECHQHSSSNDSHQIEPFCTQQQTHRTIIKRQGFKTKDNYENAPSDSDGPRDRFSNTLPVRKTKKRVEIGAKSIGPNQPSSRVNVQNVFSTTGQQQLAANGTNREFHDHEVRNTGNSSAGVATVCNEAGGSNHIQPKQRRTKAGVENCGFMSAENGEEQKMEPTESEVYFADVSSCCNNSIKNDNFYDETNQRRVDKYGKEENEDYLVQRYGKRDASIRSRVPFPQMIPEDYEKPQMHIPLVAPRASLMHKDISRQSMCSIDSGEKTDFTDLSPATPGSGFGQNYTIVENQEMHYQSRSHFTTNYKKTDFAEPSGSNFVASFPFSCNEQSQEAHRRSTKNIQEIFLAPDAQYEIITESNQFDSNSSINYDNDISFNSQTSHFHIPKSPKTGVVTPIKRQNLGTNISAIIQNLGGSDLLYPDGRRDNDSIMETQDCISNKSKTISDNEWSDHSDRRL
ncbi:hypothetical protein Bhyg_08653 [Pseudolycoriella hygida]|uniref:Uncharacterized protein n=1 Tax=Pseudolycoriella hygida TaxID=35572 RepID=A0A9Q0N511_9DIPT|nr:hypothetical protein Bhyg_08653 [Pseudolycoriella hygida]